MSTYSVRICWWARDQAQATISVCFIRKRWEVIPLCMVFRLEYIHANRGMSWFLVENATQYLLRATSKIRDPASIRQQSHIGYSSRCMSRKDRYDFSGNVSCSPDMKMIK